MAESSESLTSEQERVLSEVEEMVLSAISARCGRCSTANFAPKRIGRAVANGSISEDTAKEIAASFADCPGLKEEPLSKSSAGEMVVQMCHYPPPPK